MQYGATAVIFAAENGHLDIVRYLIEEYGADANHANKVSNDVIIYDMGWYMYTYCILILIAILQ